MFPKINSAQSGSIPVNILPAAVMETGTVIDNHEVESGRLEPE